MSDAPTVVRKKSGYPSKEDALSPTTKLSLAKIARRLCGTFPGLAPYISEAYLAGVIYEFQCSMEDHLGKDSPKPLHRVKIPAVLFRDYDDNGPLFTILDVILQNSGPDDMNPSRLRESGRIIEFFSIFDKVKLALEKSGFLMKKKIFFGASVPGDVADELTKIVETHDGVVVARKEDSTHIVEWDTGVDGVLPELLTEEFIRTLDIRRNIDGCPVATVSPGAGVPEDPYQDGSALVHWWYHPDSYDEIIPSVDVDSSEMPESNFEAEDFLNDSRETGVWCLCCRYIRDLQLFNEWGNELDYELDPEKDVGTNGNVISKLIGNSVSGRGRGRHSRNKRKVLLQPSDDKVAAPKKKVDFFSHVLEASIGTEKAVGHLTPFSYALGENRADNGCVVLDAELSVASTTAQSADNAPTDPETLCALRNDASMTSLWGGVIKINASRGDYGTAELSESKRRRVGPGHNFGVIGLSSENLTRGEADSSSSENRISDSTPPWFDPSSVSSTEIRYLPEFFDGSSCLRTADIYLSMRSFITNLYSQHTSTYLSATDCRKRMCGDAGAIIRVHSFLDAFGIINFGVPVEARPPLYPMLSLNPLDPSGVSAAPRNDSSIVVAAAPSRPARRMWSNEDDNALVKAALDHDSDWQAIGIAMGVEHSGSSGFTTEDCVVRLAELADQRSEFSSAKSPISNSAALSSSRDMLQSLVNEYVAARLIILEEKVNLLDSTETILNIEYKRQQLDRRDLQIQRAQFAFHQTQNL